MFKQRINIHHYKKPITISDRRIYHTKTSAQRRNNSRITVIQIPQTPSTTFKHFYKQVAVENPDHKLSNKN